MNNHATDTTRDRILDAAEALFAEHGFATTSLRAITARAGANLAAVSYHFGSKDALVQAVFERRLLPLNRERMQRLEALLTAHPRPKLEAILIAFIAPALALSARGVPFIRLLGRSYGEASPELRECIHQHYRPVLEFYTREVGRLLPELPDEELRWRLQFLLGAVSYTVGGIDLMRVVPDCEMRDGDDREALLRRLVGFLAAGLRAPSAVITDASTGPRAVEAIFPLPDQPAPDQPALHQAGSLQS